MQEFKKTALNKITRGAKQSSYNKKEITEIIDAGFLCYVSYVWQGLAICLPMAYARIDNYIYIHGSLKNRMLLGLIEAKKANLLIMHLDGLVLARSAFHHSVNYRSVSIFGAAELVSGSMKTAALKAVVNNMIPNRWESLRPMTEKEIKSTLVVAISIDSAAAKVRKGDVIDEKVDNTLPIWAGVIPIKQVSSSPIPDVLLAEEIQIPEHLVAYYKKNK